MKKKNKASHGTIISGIITDENGKPIPNAEVWLEQTNAEIAQTKTDDLGKYRISLSLLPKRDKRGRYDLSATSGELGLGSSAGRSTG